MLYEEDYLAWTQQQIGLLQTGNLEELDLKNLVEELKAMGRSDHRELESRLIILIAHLLKWEWQFNRLQNQWAEFEGKSWRNWITEQRIQIKFLMQKVPSLCPKLSESIFAAYPTARELASRKQKSKNLNFQWIALMVTMIYWIQIFFLFHVDSEISAWELKGCLADG